GTDRAQSLDVSRAAGLLCHALVRAIGAANSAQNAQAVFTRVDSPCDAAPALWIGINRRPVGCLDSLKAATALRIGNRFLDRGAVTVPAFVHCRHLHTKRKAVKGHQTVALSRRSAVSIPRRFSIFSSRSAILPMLTSRSVTASLTPRTSASARPYHSPATTTRSNLGCKLSPRVRSSKIVMRKTAATIAMRAPQAELQIRLCSPLRTG